MTWFRRPGAADEPGRLNLGYNVLDRHVIAGRAEEPALLGWQGADLDFAGLLAEVSALGGALATLGVRADTSVAVALQDAGDELLTVLACARIGAVAQLGSSTEPAVGNGSVRPELIVTSSPDEGTAEGFATRVLRGVAPVDPTRDVEWEVAMQAGRTQGSAVADRAPHDVAYLLEGRAVTVLGAADAEDRVGLQLRRLLAGEPVRCR